MCSIDVQGPQELSLLFLGPERGDGRRRHAEANAVLGHRRLRRAGRGQGGVHLLLKALRHTESAVSLRKLDPCEAGVEPCSEKFLRIGVRRIVGGQQLSNPGVEIAGNRLFVECHVVLR